MDGEIVLRERVLGAAACGFPHRVLRFERSRLFPRTPHSVPCYCHQELVASVHRLARESELSIGRRQPVGASGLIGRLRMCDRDGERAVGCEFQLLASRLTRPILLRPFGESGSMK